MKPESEPIAESSPSEAQLDGGSPLAPSARNSLEQEIALLESGRFCWLRQSPALEAYFEASSAASRSRRIFIEGILCVLLFDSFLISDSIFSPRNFLHSLLVRVGFATPPAVIALLLLRRGVSKALREAMVVCICAIFAISILYLYLDITPVVSSYALTDLAILVLFTNVGIRIRLPYAIVASVMCLLFGAIYLTVDSMLTNPEKLESIAILLAAVLLSLMGNYSLEHGERLTFLLRLRSDAEFGVLANANDHLLALSREDKLTGIANRGRFDEVYERVWNDAVATGSSLSVIMIDIDNFKALNDRYGHPYGDDVLRRAAILLKQCLRKKGDFLARYGGEELSSCCPTVQNQWVCMWHNGFAC
jgi:hypothetical protein